MSVNCTCPGCAKYFECIVTDTKTHSAVLADNPRRLVVLPFKTDSGVMPYYVAGHGRPNYPVPATTENARYAQYPQWIADATYWKWQALEDNYRRRQAAIKRGLDPNAKEPR